MFKAILPSKRISSSEFTMITPLGDSCINGKENQPDYPLVSQAVFKPTKPAMNKTKSFGLTHDKKKNVPQKVVQPVVETLVMEQAFDQLLDDLQIPSSLRPKLATMDGTVKAAMLKSSQVMTLVPPATPPTLRRTSELRRTRSSESLGSPRSQKRLTEFDDLQPPQTAGLFSALHSSSVGASSPGPRKSSSHVRGASFDVPRTFSRSDLVPFPGDSTTGKLTKEKVSSSAKNISPTRFFSILSGTSSTQLDVDSIKKLRLLLRNESASWSQDFLKLGGYNALLTRLNEILEIEWREEQHDDQILHELLRCLKALSTSSIGCFALRSSCPTPFTQLVALLYSDKKPGDVATRQLIVDLLLILFDLYPQSSIPSNAIISNGTVRNDCQAWDNTVYTPSSSSTVKLPAPHKTFFSLIRALLLTPAPPPSESPSAPISPHAFIESLHLPRIYKTYLGELSDICRDYFWVFCHPNNTIWVLGETDEARVEKPRAPGGMTGGVEFEAMGYFTTHMRLINALSKIVHDLDMPKEHDHSAHRFHSDMFVSGLERIILIARKASTTYYPTLHLELARYIAFAGAAGFELPWTVSRLMGLPPTGMRKNASTRGSPSVAPSSNANTAILNTTPTKRPVAPGLPSPRKIEPLRFG